jgi:hypothetical protein
MGRNKSVHLLTGSLVHWWENGKKVVILSGAKNLSAWCTLCRFFALLGMTVSFYKNYHKAYS